MARYQMKQKWLAWGDDYTVNDDSGQPAFYIDGRALSLGAKLSLQDMQHRELAFISQKLLAWGPTFEIYRDNALVAVVKKSIFTLLRAEFTVDVPGPDDLVAQGNFWDYEYTFTRHGSQVAQVSKAWFSLTDTYGVDVSDGEDDVLILAAVVVIDQCRHERRND